MSLQTRLKGLNDARDDDSVALKHDLLNLLDECQVGKAVQVLDDGFVRRVDFMGDDSAVVQAARVSYGEGTKTVNDDRGLIRYLMRHRHTTPMEMCEVKFHVRCPMDVMRQWIRHRTASVNEYSTRYSVAIDSAMETQPGEWRMQATKNKQGSGGTLDEWPAHYAVDADTHQIIDMERDYTPRNFHRMFPCTVGEYLSSLESADHQAARLHYEERLSLGVAREQARKDLPLSTYTEMFWKVDLHNLFHFLALRMDSHAQEEIRLFANAIFALVKPLFPACCEAFEDYRLNSMSLSRMDIQYIRDLVEGRPISVELSKREHEELTVKLGSLGIRDLHVATPRLAAS